MQSFEEKTSVINLYGLEEQTVNRPDLNILDEDLELKNCFLNDDILFSSQESASNVDAMAIASQSSMFSNCDMEFSSQESAANSQKMDTESPVAICDQPETISKFNELNETDINESASNAHKFNVIEEASNNSEDIRKVYNVVSSATNEIKYIISHVNCVTQNLPPQNITTVSSSQDSVGKGSGQEMSISSQESSYSMENCSQDTVIMSSFEFIYPNSADILQKDINTSSNIIDSLKGENETSYNDKIFSIQENFEINKPASNTRLLIQNLKIDCPVTVDDSVILQRNALLRQNFSDDQAIDIVSQESFSSQRMDMSQESATMCEDEVALEIKIQNQAEKLHRDEIVVNTTPSKKFCKGCPEQRKRLSRIKRREVAVKKREISMRNWEKQIAERENAISVRERFLETREKKILNYEEAVFSNF